MLNEPIHVLGAGSIGLLWTASIRSKFPTYPITLLLRDHDRNRKRVAAAWGSSGAHERVDEYKNAKADPKKNRDRDHRLGLSWNNHRLTPVQQSNEEMASTLTQQQISLPVQFINDTEHKLEPIKTLILATKAHQAKEAVESVLDRLLLPADIDTNENGNGDGGNGNSDSTSSSHTQIIVLCNGALSVQEELSKILPQTPKTNNTISLALATTTHGAYLSEPHRLVHAGVGTTFLEQQPTDDMVDVWNRAGLNCTSLSSQQIDSMLWNKLAANCVINPLTCIFRCTNGDLLLEPLFPELREDILMEVAGVAAGIAKNGAPTIEEMRDFVSQTIRDTRNNKSSMYQDIVMGQQQQTEIKHLNGFVVRKGKEIGRDCPANEDLCSRIAELAFQNASQNQ